MPWLDAGVPSLVSLQVRGVLGVEVEQAGEAGVTVEVEVPRGSTGRTWRPV